MDYKKKYLKYKLKYLNIQNLNIQNLSGGTLHHRGKSPPRTEKDDRDRDRTPPRKKIDDGDRDRTLPRKKIDDGDDNSSSPPTLEEVELNEMRYNIRDSIHIINQALSDLQDLEALEIPIEPDVIQDLKDTIINEKIKIKKIKTSQLISAKKSITQIANLENIRENQSNEIFNKIYNWENVKQIREFLRSVFTVSNQKHNFIGKGTSKDVFRVNINKESIESLKILIKDAIPYIKLIPEKYVVSILKNEKDIIKFHNVLNFLQTMNLNLNYIHLPYFFIKDIGKTYYTIEEYLDVDLYTIIEKETQYYDEKNKRLKIIFNLLKCLDELHENNFCHLDIKPENFLVKKIPDDDYSLQIKLTDFDFMEEFNLIPFTDLKGSLQYIDPNVVHIKRKFYSGDEIEFNDLYGIGIIYYLLIKGNFPYNNSYYHKWTGEKQSNETANTFKTPEDLVAKKKAIEILDTVQNKKKNIEEMSDGDEKNARLSAVMKEEATEFAKLEDYLYKDGFYLDIGDNFERKFISYLCNSDLSKRFKTKDLIEIMEVEMINLDIQFQKKGAKKTLDF